MFRSTITAAAMLLGATSAFACNVGTRADALMTKIERSAGKASADYRTTASISKRHDAVHGRDNAAERALSGELARLEAKY